MLDDDSGKHLMQIINDILDLSKIEAGRLEVEKLPVSPFHLLKDVKSLASLQAQEKELQCGNIEVSSEHGKASQF